MINIVTYEGGLGNQMFQYAFFLALKKRYPNAVFLFDIYRSFFCHNGFELYNVFQIKGRFRYRLYIFLKNWLKLDFSRYNIVEQENPLIFDPKYLNIRSNINVFRGFWQSEKWFFDISSDIRVSFKFLVNNVNLKTRELAKKLLSRDAIFCSIHVRRGDYLLLSDFGILNIGYYREAIELVRNRISQDVKFCVFSDDIEWCKSNFHIDAIYVNWNKGKEAWQDMYLMSLCDHNIIANSSFGWWGAWLNENPNKLVLVPNKWFLSSPNYDVIPSSWIKIDTLFTSQEA